MKILVYYGGSGIEQEDPDSIVSVSWGESMPVLMKASEAKPFYDKITTEKAIWGGWMFTELIEAHHFIDSDDKIEIDEVTGEDKLPF